MTPPSPHVAAIVLAAGLGTRMRSRRPKILHDLCGRPMLAYVLEAAREATGSTPLVVYSPHTAALCETFAGQAEFALQDEPRGTGDAVRAALAALPAEVTEVAVLSGDTPLLQASTVTAVLEARRAADAAMAITTVRLDDPAGYGRVVRDGRRVTRIVEEKDASDDERDIDEVNAGLYAFDAAWLRRAVDGLAPSEATGEFYLTALVELALRDGRIVAAHEHDDELELGGINDRVQLAAAEAELRWQVLERHMLAGVTMIDPLGVYLDAMVELDEDVTLEAGVVLRGATRVGRDSVIRSGSQLVDSVVGEGCTIWASVLESATVEDGAVIGPFAHLRPGAHVGARAEIGNFAEIKKARLGAGTKQHHFSYIGDAEIGAEVNIGAGTITANYDGQAKHRTVIGDGAFIGSDTIIRAPVTIGAGAYTGAGSVVTRDVPPGKLAVGVPARIRERKPGAGSKPGPTADSPPHEGAT